MEEKASWETKEEQEEEQDLPVEQKIPVPEDLVVTFSERVALDVSNAQDMFDDCGQDIFRDNANKAEKIEDITKRVNKYSYAGSFPGVVGAKICTIATCGMYYVCKRRVIDSGKFGRYTSTGREMLLTPGIHVLHSWSDVWARHLDIDFSAGGSNTVRLGSKLLLMVPENHLAGAYSIGKAEGDKKDDAQDSSDDGDYVLFGQGRHVLNMTEYRDVEVVDLKRPNVPKPGEPRHPPAKKGRNGPHKVIIGPLTILYVKEGFLGGAYDIKTGKYRVFTPGPPYMLHKKNYDQVKVEKRTTWFKLGPIDYMTIRDGELGGAYHKQTGLFKLLPPGYTYRLHSKDYESLDRKPRTEYFKLGPYIFLTVKKGFLAGVYKKKGGKFVILPPGQTYQLNEEEYEVPGVKKITGHKTLCGPYTYVTIQSGTLSGAYKISDGTFEVFSNTKKKYKLHEKEYHGFVTIDKYSFNAQRFGPNSVITVACGSAGVFEKEGTIQIRKPGWHNVGSEYTIRPSIPITRQVEALSGKRFDTKDGIKMSVKSTLIWHVHDAKLAALFPGSFTQIQRDIRFRFDEALDKFCQKYNRDELLPTKQDIVERAGKVSSEKLQDMLSKEVANTIELYTSIESDMMNSLVASAAECGWGAKVVLVKIEGFELLERQIQSVLDGITLALLQTDRSIVEGDLKVAEAEIDKEVRFAQMEASIQSNLEREKMNAKVARVKADSLANVDKTKALAEAYQIMTRAKCNNEVAVLSKTVTAAADAAARRINLKIRTAEIRETANARAEAITVVAEANFFKVKQENEAAKKMPEKLFKLKMADRGVLAMREMGRAEWRMPDKVLQFYESFSPFLRMGPVTAGELLQELDINKKGGNRR